MIGGNKCNDSVVHVAVLTSISRTNSIKLYTEGKREEFKGQFGSMDSNGATLYTDILSSVSHTTLA